MLSPTAKKELRQQIARFCLVAQKYEERWHYTQARPYTGLGTAPAYTHHNDCSSYVALSYFWASHMAGVSAADPLGEHYSGSGNTSTAHEFLDAHVAPVDKYRIGDVAMYLKRDFRHHHMSVCVVAGTGATAVFSSFGQEAGPEPTKLHYRNDLTAVFRHPALL